MGDEIWEKIWKKNLITSDYSLKYLDFMTKIEQTLPVGSRVLEAGCGTGQALSLFSARHVTYGLDISPAALELAQKNCRFPVLGSIFLPPFADNSFDLVYNSGVIEHFPDPENSAAVRQMGRVVKPSGRVIIIVPNTLCIWYKAGKWCAGVMKNFEFGYEEDYSPRRIRQILQRAGLSIERVFGLQALPPLATNDREILPLSWRKKIGSVERFFPAKHYYAYTVGVIARKTSSSL
jgi:SAM-dependent methyltransferase